MSINSGPTEFIFIINFSISTNIMTNFNLQQKAQGLDGHLGTIALVESKP